MAARRRVRIAVRRDTARRLRSYCAGRSVDDILNDLMAVHPPQEFIVEQLRRLREEPRTPWSEVRRGLRL